MNGAEHVDVESPVRDRDEGRLGQILLAAGHLTAAQLDEGLILQQQRPERIGQLLCRLGHVDHEAVVEALVAQSALACVRAEGLRPAADALALVPADVAFRYSVLPLACTERGLTVAMADPFDLTAVESLRVLTGRRIDRCHAAAAELAEAIRGAYGSSVARMIADLDVEASAAAGEDELTIQLEEMAREPSVVNLVNLTILEAVQVRASDIHVEPFEKTLKIKYRIDGILHEISPPPKRLQPAIISRLKIMAGMNIAERFIPQDGHIAFTTPSGKIDLRVATVPTIFGECVVMRILDRSTALIDLEHLGLGAENLSNFESLLTRPHGIVLVTGPTGSGKTTTLYAALNKLYTPAKKIITIEDPVEYQLDGINQIPVNRKRGLDFANGLRAIVRQDPDIIMIGEIRDRETADIAIRSALTGHLVFSTLHTNDAPGAVTRLVDMGVEPFLLASSLEAVLAQRLVRTICPECREPHRPEPSLLQRIGHPDGNGEAAGGAFFHGAGCAACRQTGYTGRRGIFELLRVTSRVREAISRRGNAAEIAAVAPKDHRPMREDGYRKAARGITTLEEVLRVTQDTQTEDALS
ncbi:MAG: Flp pilus assembly complex ATPase component TadA [Planctomycetes bacterium]|nr:Flp pilus assembly complex ATPase component TadA [Planctomycetota bacterium]